MSNLGNRVAKQVDVKGEGIKTVSGNHEYNFILLWAVNNGFHNDDYDTVITITSKYKFFSKKMGKRGSSNRTADQIMKCLIL